MGYEQLHRTWKELVDWTGNMASAHGGIVYEKDSSRQWDWGQALCRELYGPEWMIHPDFLASCDIPPGDPAPQESLDRARSWASGDVPDWVKEGTA